MAVINTTQVKVLRSVVSTNPGTTAGEVDANNTLNNGANAAQDVGKNTIRYELIKENLGDTPDALIAYENQNVSKIHSNSN